MKKDDAATGNSSAGDDGYIESLLETQNRRLRLFQSVIARSVSGITRGKALNTLVNEMAETFGYDFCNVFMADKDGLKLQIVASHGYTEEFIRKTNDGDMLSLSNEEFIQAPAAKAFLNGEQCFISDLHEDTIGRDLLEVARHYSFRSIAATPLEYRGDRLGVLAVNTSEVHEFDKEELAFLTSIAGQAATIAGSARIYKDLADSEERYRELYNKAADWMYTLDDAGVIIECNETMAEALELTISEIVGRHIYDLETSEDREKAKAVIDAFREKIESDLTFSTERTFTSSSGKKLIVELHARSMADEASGTFQWRVIARDITDKKEAEQRLKLLAAAVENTHECVVITDLNGDILSINEAGAAMFGRSAEELTGGNTAELWSDDNPEGLRDEIFTRTMEDGWEGQMNCRRADGTDFPVFVSSSLVEDADGKPFAMVGIARDISVEQRMTAEILRRNRELAVLNAVATEAASSVDLETMLQASVDSLIDSIGYDVGMIYLFDADAGSLSLSASANIPDFMVEVLCDGGPGEGVAGAVVASGKPLAVENIKESRFRPTGEGAEQCPIISAAGIPIITRDNLLGVIIIGCFQKHSFDDQELELLAAVARTIGVAIENARLFDDVEGAKKEWETTFDAMTNGVSIHDRDFTILRANRALGRLLGKPPGELIGKKCYEVFHNADAPLSICPQKKAFEEGTSHSITAEEPSLGRILAISSDPIFDQAGKITGAVHDVRDITEQEQLREQLGQSEKIRALGEMAGGVAHDFNNFLTVILGNAQLLLASAADNGLDPDFRESLESMQRAATDAAETVRRIQEFTRVRTSRSFTTVDVNRILQNTVEVASPRWRDEAIAAGRSIEIKTDLSDIPPVNGNESELAEVFVNLVLNATDALTEGGVITLASDVEPGGQWLKVVVADNGKGMDEEERKRIFEPFFTTKGVAGTGLGLSVAYGIVNRHGGDIIVQSRKGEGTRFTVRLPVATVADLSEAAELAQVEELARSAVENGSLMPAGKVLVIDDEAMVRTLIGDMLERMGNETIIAASGREGIEIFDAAIESGEPFDLVLSDLGMSEMSGWQVVEEVKNRSPETSVVLITGWGDQLDREKMKQSRVDRVLAKPFSVDDIKLLLSQALSR